MSEKLKKNKEKKLKKNKEEKKEEISYIKKYDNYDEACKKLFVF